MRKIIASVPFLPFLPELFLVLLYCVITAATLKRIRLQLYETLLSDALERKELSAGKP